MKTAQKLIKEQNQEKFSGAKIEFVNIGKKYEGRVDYTLENINLTIESGEFCTILGPSGCGKTTLLRMIAGLTSVSKGDLLFNHKRVNDLEPASRDIAMVFQSYALYPHMNVYKNVSFGLEQQKVRKDIIDRRTKDIADILKIKNHLYDKPKDLSGGQRQRVAIARAIVRKPSVFLMDEPLSNLDAKLRESTRREIVNIHKMIGTTSVYVTHDQLEAMTMADKIVIMNDAVIQQIGQPQDLYFNPSNLFVARFIGSPTINIIKGEFKDGHFLGSNNLKINLSSRMKQNFSGPAYLGSRSEEIGLVENANDPFDFQGAIEHVEFIGKDKVLSINSPISDKMILVTVPSWIKIEVDQVYKFKIRTESARIFDANTKKRISADIPVGK